MTWKIELGACLATMAGAGAFVGIVNPLAPPSAIERTSSFTEGDFAAFDRNFRHGRETCAIGLEKQRLCFKPSPLEGYLIEGTHLAAHIPLMPAEFPVLVATNVSANGQKLARFGQSLALVDEETRMVVEVMRLDETSFADATATLAQDLADNSTVETDA
ncbi:MAG: hypothetical protein AAGK23_01410 [Pseudomonadota bacterium]